LPIIQTVAREKGLHSVWAWVLYDNLIAQRAFEKNGFAKTGISEREYNGIIKQSIEYTLDLVEVNFTN
jgi:RimJ/RimL family protein N-acetyltransferase